MYAACFIASAVGCTTRAHAVPHAAQGGTVDVDAAARMVLTDWNDGRIPYFAEPPQRGADDHAAAAIVAGWSAEFEADQVRSEDLLCHTTSVASQPRIFHT